MKDSDEATDTIAGIPLVPNPSEELLNERQYLDYRSEREQCLEWLLKLGKQPDCGEGYAKTTMETRASRINQFYRWVWEYEGGYTSSLTHEHADGYLTDLAGEDDSEWGVVRVFEFANGVEGVVPFAGLVRNPIGTGVPSSSKTKSTVPARPRYYCTSGVAWFPWRAFTL